MCKIVTQPLLARSLCLALLCLPLLATAQSANKGVPVAVVEASTQSIKQQINLTGSITAAQVAQLSVETSGLTTRVMVDAGSMVEAGSLLLTLHSELAELTLTSLQAQWLQNKAELDDAKRRLRESKALVTDGSVSESTVKDLQAEVQIDTATAKQSGANVAYQQALLERHRMRAPFTGVITRKHVEQGEWVIPGQGLFELVSHKSIRAEFQVPQFHFNRINKNAEVTLQLDANPQHTFVGKVQQWVPVSDINSRSFLLRITSTAFDSSVIPGMSVQARLQLPTGESAVTVPRDALLRHADGRTSLWQVITSDKGLVVNEKVVQAGLAFNGWITIKSGLEAGARVVIRGNESLREGQQVYLVREAN